MGQQELQETLKLESEMVAMIERYEQILSESYETVERRQLTHVSALKTVLSGQPLTEGQLDELRLVGYLENLVLQRRNMKDWLTREILELDREGHGS